MKLIYNEAVDFLFSIKRFAERNKPQEHSQPGVPELKQWCEDCEKELSPFLLNDITLLVEKMILPTVYIFMRFTENSHIKTGKELLELIGSTGPDQFNDFLKAKLLKNPQDELSVNRLYEILIDEGANPGYDPVEESQLLYGFLQDSAGFLKRLHSTYSDFYRLAYLPAKKKYSHISADKLAWHSERLKQGEREYLNLLGLQSFLKHIGDEHEPVLYYSFFADSEISTFWSIQTVVIGAGTDNRIIHRSARDKASTFFSCFGDPKRLEILRLTAQRPWFSSELAKHFNLKPATLSYHMNILTEAELLNLENGESRRFYYSLNREKVKEYLKEVSRDLLGPET